MKPRILFQDMNEVTFDKFLKFIYTGKEEVIGDDVAEMLRMAAIFQVSGWESYYPWNYNNNCYLRGVDTLGGYSAIFTREITGDFPISSTSTPFWKGVCSTRKEFAFFGSYFFPCRIDLFSERIESHFW